jgi:alpha-1,6-mannosyltransferase
VATIAGIVLCAWGIKRVVALAGGNAIAAAIAGVTNPAVLIVLVGGIHNDALMIGLTVAGVALAVSAVQPWGIILCALGAAVKPPALLMVGALSWWAWGSGLRDRAKGVLVGAVSVVGVLLIAGSWVGGGFAWFSALLSDGSIPGSFSLGARFFDVKSGPVVDVIELVGVALSVLLVLRTTPPYRWVAATGWGLAVLALSSTKPEPWYLAWAVVVLACGGLYRRSEVVGVLVLTTMMAGSVIALGTFWWFGGVILLSWLGISSVLFRHRTAPGLFPDN